MTINPLDIPALETAAPLSWTSLSITGLSLAIANAASAYARPLVVIPPDAQTALLLNENLAFFSDLLAEELTPFGRLDTTHDSTSYEKLCQRHR